MGAEFVVNKLGKKKVAILFASDDLYSSGLAKEFREEAEEARRRDRDREELPQEGDQLHHVHQRDQGREARDHLRAHLLQRRWSPIARQAKAAGVKGDMFVGGDGWDADELLNDAGEELEGAYFTNHYAPDVPWPNARPSSRSTRSATSATRRAWRPGLRRGQAARRRHRARQGRDAGRIRQAIQETKDFQGATGDHHDQRRAQRRQAHRHRPDQGQEVHLLRHGARQVRGVAAVPTPAPARSSTKPRRAAAVSTRRTLARLARTRRQDRRAP